MCVCGDSRSQTEGTSKKDTVGGVKGGYEKFYSLHRGFIGSEEVGVVDAKSAWAVVPLLSCVCDFVCLCVCLFEKEISLNNQQQSR